MKLNSSFVVLATALVLALCLEQAQAESVEAPLGLTKVDDKEGVPVTPLTYLNLEPQTKELADAAKKITTPPPLPHQKRLLAVGNTNPATQLVEDVAGGALHMREVGSSLIPSLPILGTLDNEGDHTNANPPAAPARRLLGALTDPSTTHFMPKNEQQLGNRNVHPLSKRDGPLNLDLLGQTLPELVTTKLPGSKRSSDTGLNILGQDVPLKTLDTSNLLNNIKMKRDGPLDLGLVTGEKQTNEQSTGLLDGMLPMKRDDGPVDLGLKTGNQQDLDRAKGLFDGVLPALPIKRDDSPLDLGLTAGNQQDMDRAKGLLSGFLPGLKRDTISPDNVDLSSLKGLGQEAAKMALPVALMPVKQTASPAVQGIKAAEGLCTAFNCVGMEQGLVNSAKQSLPLPVPRGIAEDLLPNSPLGGGGMVDGVPLKRQDPLTGPILGLSDQAKDKILGVKDEINQVSGDFAKNLYTHPTDKRDFTLPPLSLLPGTGPEAKKMAQETIDFLGLPIPGMAKRMEKVVRRGE